jgi:hypothetical protein
LLPGAERRKDRERTFVKMDRRLVEDGAGEVGHGRTSEVGIDICRHVRSPIGSGKGEIEETCSAVIVAFDPAKISAGRRFARLQEVAVHLKKTNRRGLRQEDRKLLHQLGKSTFAVT